MDSISRDQQIMVEIGPPVTVWQSPRSELAGRWMDVRDIHQQPLTRFKLQMYFKAVGDVRYYMYIPLPVGDELEKFIRELAEHEDIRL